MALSLPIRFVSGITALVLAAAAYAETFVKDIETGPGVMHRIADRTKTNSRVKL